MPLLIIGIALLLAASGVLWLVARRQPRENATPAAAPRDDWLVFVVVGLHTAVFAVGIGFVFAGLTGADL